MNKVENPWTTLSEKTHYDNDWIKIKEYQVLNPNGNDGIYGVVHVKNLAMGIIPLDDHYNTWIIGQYRYPLDIYSWEIPEGGGKLSLNPLDSAKRELLEETGIKAGKWIELIELHTSNCMTDERALIYIAQDLSYGEAQPDDDEKLEIRKLPFEEVYKMTLKGEITDAMSVAAILKAKIWIEAGKI